MVNTAAQRVDSDTLMSDSDQPIGPLDNPPLGICTTNYAYSDTSPTSPFSFPDLNTSPANAPAGLSLVLPHETNFFHDEPKNIVFSSNLKLNTLPLFSETPETYSIPENNHQEEQAMGMEFIPAPMMLGALTAEDIMMSEEYTCVRVLNGPNPRVTHIFGDYVLQGHPFDCAPIRIDHPSPANPHQYSSSSNLGLSSDELILKICSMCKNVLQYSDDVYRYRDLSFCSEECRYQEMWLDHQEEKMKRAQKPMESVPSGSDTSTSASASEKVVFFIGDDDMPKSQSW